MNFLTSEKNRNFIYLSSIYLIIYFLFTQFNINDNYIKDLNLEGIYNFNLYLEIINNKVVEVNYSLVDYYFYYLIYLFAPYKVAFGLNSISLSLIIINVTTLTLLYISLSKLLEEVIFKMHKITDEKTKGKVFLLTTIFSLITMIIVYYLSYQNLFINNTLLNFSLILFIIYYSLLFSKEEYLEIDYIVLIAILCSLLSLNLL